MSGDVSRLRTVFQSIDPFDPQAAEYLTTLLAAEQEALRAVTDCADRVRRVTELMELVEEFTDLWRRLLLTEINGQPHRDRRASR